MQISVVHNTTPIQSRLMHAKIILDYGTTPKFDLQRMNVRNPRHRLYQNTPVIQIDCRRIDQLAVRNSKRIIDNLYRFPRFLFRIYIPGKTQQLFSTFVIPLLTRVEPLQNQKRIL